MSYRRDGEDTSSVTLRVPPVSLRLGHATALTATGSHSLPCRRFATHWRRLLITIDLNVLSVCCEESVSISLPQWGKGDHRRWWMRCPPSISHKITSVGGRQTHISNRNPRELDRRNAKPHESPCFCARAPKNRGIPSYLIGYEHFRIKSENAPILFGGFLRTLSCAKGELAQAPIRRSRKRHSQNGRLFQRRSGYFRF